MTPALAKDVDPNGEFYNAQFGPDPALPTDAPEGMLEYECRTAIRNLMRRFGTDAGREMVAMYINDEMAGRRM